MGDEGLTVPELFDLLSHPRRRAVLLLVGLAPDDGVALRTVAETVCAVEHDVTPTAAPTRKVTNVRGNLTRSHLDALEAGGLITVGPHDRLSVGPEFGVGLAMIAFAYVGVDDESAGE